MLTALILVHLNMLSYLIAYPIPKHLPLKTESIISHSDKKEPIQKVLSRDHN